MCPRGTSSDAQAMIRLEQFSQSSGISIAHLLNKLIAWTDGQSPLIRRAVLGGTTDAGQHELRVLLLNHLAKKTTR